MKSYLLSCILLFFAAGCDFFNLSDKAEAVSGRWTSNVVPQAGDCCHLDLTLISDDKGDITGTGIVATPGQRVGSVEEFAIEVEGALIDDRISLTLTSEYNPGTIKGSIIRDFNSSSDMVIEVDFVGFGFTGRDIVLFPRPSSSD